MLGPARAAVNAATVSVSVLLHSFVPWRPSEWPVHPDGRRPAGLFPDRKVGSARSRVLAVPPPSGRSMPRTRTTTVRDLRKSNRSLALWQVFLNGPLTRQEVGDLSGLSTATVSNLVAALEAEGVVVEVGLEDSNGGRPRGLLQVNPEYGYVIGVDVGETAFLVELFDFRLQLRARHTSVTDMAVLDPEDAVSHITEGIESVIAESGVDRRAILGVGVAVPGLVEHREDAVV